MTPSRRSLQTILEGCRIDLTSAQYDQLWAYHGMLRAANPELNLTRIHNFENMVLKHHADSLLVLRLEELPSPLVDMGSGPGLPGIPLKIARPGLEMVLAEPRGGRARFLEEVCGNLRLTGVEVYAGKVGPRFTRRVGGVITRAVATIPETLDRVAACLGPGGRMYFMKGPDCDGEIVEARSTHAGAFALAADHAYDIPGTTHRRRLVVYERLEGPVRTFPSDSESIQHRGPSREVSSETNPTYRLCLDVLTGRGIRKHGLALVAGTRQVDEVRARFHDRVESWVTGTDGPPPPDDAPGLTWVRMTDALFRTIDVAGTHAPLLLTRVPETSVWDDAEEWPPGCTLFVPFQDPENVGAVIRSAAAFGAARVVLLQGAAHPFHPRGVRAAGPALFQVPLLQGPSIDGLASARHPLVALATDGQDLEAEPFPETFGLVVGVEGPGLPDHLRAGPRRRIAIEPNVESLNAATAAAVALHVWRRGRLAHPGPGQE